VCGRRRVAARREGPRSAVSMMHMAGKGLRAAWVVVALAALAGRGDAARGEPALDVEQKAYLFTSFHGNGEDGLRFLYSFDGYQWLNVPGTFLKPRVGPSKLMRDPSLARGPDGTWHLAWTTGWRGDQGFGHASSKDLVHWSPQQFVPVMAHEPTTVNVWAPELYYDDEEQLFVICWASTIPGRFPDGEEEHENNHRMYYTTTRDFHEFAPSKLFIQPGFSVIDGTIVRDGERYVLVHKDNTRPQLNLRVAFGDSPTGPWRDVSAPFTEKFTEGPSVLRVDNKWLIYYDAYRKSIYGAVETKDFKTFVDVTDQVSFPPLHKHGTVVRVARTDVDRLLGNAKAPGAKGPAHVLQADAYRHYVDKFAGAEGKPVGDAWKWIAVNAPLLDCPAGRLEEIYYFRWWCFQKHIESTPHGLVLTEFIAPVSHEGPHHTISSGLGHHIAEGRWMRDPRLVDEYARFWFRSGEGGRPAKHFHQFSSWATAALYNRYLVTLDGDFLVDLLDDFITDYRQWEAERRRPDGLFWQYDVRDGMEESISGSRTAKNARPTINSYMAANARAIARVARLAGRAELAEEFEAKSRLLHDKLVAAMWDPKTKFFKVHIESGELSDAREAIGYIPWMFGLGGPEHAEAWKQIKDPGGFWAPCGLTTAEQRHPKFRTHGTGTCEWDGAVWPFATSQTLTGLANLLRGSSQPFVTRHDYFEQLLRYADSHQQNGQAYLGEYLDETTGQWLITGPKSERSRYYNHSTFADLVIAGLVGLVPRKDDVIEVDPLLPQDAWDWFCLDGVRYHGRDVAILWDRTGARYGRGAGLSLWVDGREAARRPDLGRLTAELSPAAAR